MLLEYDCTLHTKISRMNWCQYIATDLNLKSISEFKAVQFDGNFFSLNTGFSIVVFNTRKYVAVNTWHNYCLSGFARKSLTF